MGEVYAAEDTTLGRAVALKFLPAERQGSDWRLHLAHEVAIAQRVSHPNVCRIHEIGGFEDRVFLSMELIQGETLQQVLSRSLGQLTLNEKLRIAHDLCDGLGAIHRQGILHCDFKPSNVMLESSERAIVTDFGLATAAALGGSRGSGTPEYMAPEQMAGGGSTFRTDIYALGLVLHEIFVGGRWKASQSPAWPAASEADSKIREAVLRCLQENPEDRPGSPEEAAALLPPRPFVLSHTDDWLVPPETLLVSPRYRPRPWVARALFAAVVLALALVPILAPRAQIASLVEFPEPPVVLAAKAREHLVFLGYGETSRDRLYGFSFQPHGSALGSERGSAVGNPSPVQFWYRQSSALLTPLEPGSAFRLYEDPPSTAAGTVGVHLDERGRLRALDAEPDGSSDYGPWPEPAWQRLFSAAGFASESFEEVVPAWTPPVFADVRRAWLERSPPPGQAAFRIEAAAFHGRPVALRVMQQEAGRAGLDAVSLPVGNAVSASEPWLARLISSLWFFSVLAAGVFLAPRNLLRRRADRQAAFRLALFVFISRVLVAALGADHRRGFAEVEILQGHLAQALYMATLVWIIYVALEPYARFWWPQQTASWVRLLYGRWRDPLVGRDLLVGTLFGLGAVLGSQLFPWLLSWFGFGPSRPDRLGLLAWQVGLEGALPQLEALRGLRHTLSMAVFSLVHGTLVAFIAVVGIVLLRRLIRHPLLSRSLALALLTMVLLPSAHPSVPDLLAAVIGGVVWLAMLIRFGFLFAVTSTSVSWLLSSIPLTLDPASWYAPGSTIVLVSVLVLAGLGFFVSLEREKVVPPWLLNLEGDGAVAAAESP
jgi:serine/threonine-protein kinase